MTNQELELVKSQLKPYTDDVLLAELDISRLGLIEIEIELSRERQVNSELLKSILEYLIKNIESIKKKSNEILNSLARIKDLKMPKDESSIDFLLVGISIDNEENIQNQFKLVFVYDPKLVQQNADILGYRTVNYSGSKNHYYLSGVNWRY